MTAQAHGRADGADQTTPATPTGSATGQSGEVHASNGDCLDVNWGNGSTDADGTPVQVHACNGGTNQQRAVARSGTASAIPTSSGYSRRPSPRPGRHARSSRSS